MLRGDDVYVLEPLRSSSCWRHLFAFDARRAKVDYVSAWWTGVVLQRRYIRVPASALLWLESHLFGASPIGFSAVTLALVAGSCLLIYAEASRHLPRRKAVMIALVPAVHPATSEIVELMNRQPIALAGLFAVAAAVGWIRHAGAVTSLAACAGALLACALAVMAYEAAIALPFALVLADLAPKGSTETGPRRWGPRLGALSVAALYVPFAVAIRHGLVAPDTSSPRALAEVALALRYDVVAYVLKAIGLFDPLDPASYWLQRTAGEPLAIAITLAILLGLAVGFRGQRAGWLGVVAFALFLAPPLLTRAAVSRFNLPTLRQLYLPILLGAPLMAAAWLSVRSRTIGLSLGVWLFALTIESILCAGQMAPNGDTAEVARTTASLLHGVPPDDTVVGIGEETCRFSPTLIRDGPAVLAIPAGRDEADPELTAIGSHALLARAAGGFDVTTADRLPVRSPGPGPGPGWLTHTPPPLVHQGWQRITGATVSVVEHEADSITALRYDFDQPLTDLVFIRFRGCAPPSLVKPLGLAPSP